MATVQQYKPKTRKVTIGYTNTALYGWQRQNQSALDLINQYNTRVNNGEWLSVEDRAKYKSAVDTYTSSGTALRNASKHYGTTYTDEEEKSWLDSLSSLNTGYTGINDFYNQFESDKVYGDWLESKNRDEAYNSNFTNIDTNKATQGWEKYNADYKPKGMTKEEMVQMGFETMNDNPLVSAFNHAVYTYKNDDSYMRPNDNWSQEQKNVFGQLYLENPAKAYEFAEETNNRNNKAKEEATIKSIQDMAVNNPILNTLGSIAAAPYAWADYFNNMAKIAAGRDVNKYNTSDGIVTPGEYSQAVQSGITTHLNDTYGTIKVDIPFLKGFVDEVGLGTVYGLGTSIAQSLIYGKLGKLAGLNGLSSSAIGYFGSAATNGMNDAIQRGATDEVGLLYGTILGVLEVGMESIGLDNLIKMDASKTMSGLVKNISAQSLSEGGEELGTSIGTSVADILLLGDKSAFAYDVSFYKNKGYNDKDAKWAAFGDMLGGWMQDATTGAISGGVSGAAMAVPSTIYSNTMANRYHSDKAPSMVNELITNEGTKAIGEKYQNKINSGKKLSGFDVSHMLDLTDRAKVKDAITNQLTEYGETSDISTLAEALTKQTMGE